MLTEPALPPVVAGWFAGKQPNKLKPDPIDPAFLHVVLDRARRPGG